MSDFIRMSWTEIEFSRRWLRTGPFDSLREGCPNEPAVICHSSLSPVYLTLCFKVMVPFWQGGVLGQPGLQGTEVLKLNWKAVENTLRLL